MNRSRLLTTAAPAAVALAAAAILASTASAACVKPLDVKAVPAGAHTMRLTWQAPRNARRNDSFRVLRGRAVIGQTTRHFMTVNVVPGQPTKLAVGIVGAAGAAPRCYAQRKVTLMKVASSAPNPTVSRAHLAAPALLSATRLSDTQVRLSWGAVHGASAYRVIRDGAVVGQTNKLSMTVNLAPGAGHSFTVGAVAANGQLGIKAMPLTLSANHRAPVTPTGLGVVSSTANTLDVSWQTVSPTSAPVRGYRVFRNGQVVGQTASTTMLLANLAPLHSYQVQVAAVDSQGYISALSAPITATTQRPAQSTGSVRVWVLTDTQASIADFEAHYTQVGEMYPTYFGCDLTNPGQVDGTDNPQLTRWAQQRGIAVAPRVNCQTPSVEHTIFTNPAVQQNFINQVTSLVAQYGYQGINLDFEGGAPTDRAAYTAFIGALADALHAQGAVLSIDISPKYVDNPTQPRNGIYDYLALSQEADEVIVMTWGWHWTTSGPGPSAPIGTVKQVVQYIASMPNKSRFVLALANYAFDWENGGGIAHPAAEWTYSQLQSLITQTGAQPTLDPTSDEWTFNYTDAQGNTHQVWYDTAQTLADRFALAGQYGLDGVAFWYASQESPQLWQTTPMGGSGL